MGGAIRSHRGRELVTIWTVYAHILVFARLEVDVLAAAGFDRTIDMDAVILTPTIEEKVLE